MASFELPVSKNVWDFDPRSIPGCIIWIDAADTSRFTLNGNNVVTAVQDKSVLNNTMVTTTTGATTAGYQWSATNFNSAYPAFFTNSALQACNIGATASIPTYGVPLTTFVVAKYSGLSSSGNSFLYDSPNRIAMNGPITANGVSNGISIGTSASVSISQQFPTGTYPSSPFINCGFYNGASSSIYTNGTIQPLNNGAGTTGTLGTGITFGTGSICIGSRITNISAWWGSIAEVLFYNNALSNAERQQVEGYLAWKWGLQTSLPSTHPYAPTYSIVRPLLRTFQPTDVSTSCLLWFDGADSTALTLSGSNVTAWKDKSGNANNITSFSSTQPTYDSSTGLLTFTNGTGTTTSSISLTSTTSYSIFYVISFPTGLTDNNAFVYARSFQLSGTPLFFFGVSRGTYAVNVSGASISGSNTTYNVATTSGLTTGNTVTIAGITLGAATGYNGTGVVQSFVTNTSITINITSTGTPTSFSGATARNGTSNVNYYSEGNAGGGPYFFFATGQGFNTYSGSTFIASMTQSGATTYTLGMNGNVSAQTATTATMANRQVVIGAGSGSAYGLGEVLFYDGALSTQDRQKVEGYLIWKWGAQRTAYPGASTNIPTTHPFYRFPTPTLTPFNPILQTNLLMWYDGADTSSLTLSGSTITAWNDKSGNGNHLTVAVGPTRTATSSNPAGWDVSFDGSTQYIRSNALAVTNGTNTMTAFIVVKNAISATLGRIIAGITSGPETTENGAFRFANAGTNSIAITKGSLTGTQDGTNYTISSDLYHVITITWNGAANSPVFVDGSLNNTYSANSNTTFSFTRFGLGASLGTSPSFTPATFWTGSLNEVVIYSSALSSTQRRQMEGYLAWKWGINSSLPTTHPYYKVTP